MGLFYSASESIRSVVTRRHDPRIHSPCRPLCKIYAKQMDLRVKLAGDGRWVVDER
jgi:hypothetical protein